MAEFSVLLEDKRANACQSRKCISQNGAMEGRMQSAREGHSVVSLDAASAKRVAGQPCNAW